MENGTKNNVQLILKNTDALSGTPKILMRQAFALSNLGHKVSVISETFHPSLSSSSRIKCIRNLKWPKNTLTQRKLFNWQATRKMDPNALVVGHGDTLNQDILFMHTCVHKGAEVNPGPHNNKNLSIPFHKMIFEQGHFKEVVCVSHMMKNDLQKRFNIKVPMHVIYPGHDKDIVKN
jgi:UDP-glucose:(heptosyl)LPS alpha-1,3-glucosyltransferase